LLKSLLSLVNKKWGDAQIDEIVNNLTVRQDGLWHYTGTGFSSKIAAERVSYYIPQGKTIYAASLIKKCNDLKINKIPSLEGIDDDTKKFFIDKVNRIQWAVYEIAENGKVTHNILNNISNTEFDKTASKALPIDKQSVKTHIINPLNEIIDLFNSRASINA
jgi:hypothetical protein